MNRILLRSFFFILLTSIAFVSCEKNDEFPVDIQAHDFVWKGLNAYYLYQDQVEDLSDRRFSNDGQLQRYLREFESPNNIFNALRIGSDTRSALIPDYNTVDQVAPLRSAFITGLEFAVMRDPNNPDAVIGYVLDVLPNSNASMQNIERGDFFYAVIDDTGTTVPLTEENYTEQLVEYSHATLSLLMADFDGTTVTPNGDQVDLVKENYQHPAIHMSKVFDLAPNRVGYLLYDNDFSGNYTNDLNATMQSFRNDNVNELIIDLRYNIGGGSFASLVAELASMITRQFENEILIKETWNSKAQSWFETNQPDSLLTRFPTTLENGTPINSLNLTDVYIILNGVDFRGTSTIELLINSLRSYVNVHIIGDDTQGNNLGSITLYDSPDYDPFQINMNHTYGLQPAVLIFSNSNDQTYIRGISPTIRLCPIEDPLNLGELGETSDPILNRVLNFITSGNVGVNPACNPLDFEVLYHSINQQRLMDNGIFIKQDLPNLGR